MTLMRGKSSDSIAKHQAHREKTDMLSIVCRTRNMSKLWAEKSCHKWLKPYNEAWKQVLGHLILIDKCCHPANQTLRSWGSTVNVRFWYNQTVLVAIAEHIAEQLPYWKWERGGMHRQQECRQPCLIGDIKWWDWHLLGMDNAPSKLTGVQNVKQKPAEHSQPGSGCCCEVDSIRDVKIGANPVLQLSDTK